MTHVPFEIALKESFICAQGNCKKAVGEGKLDCTGNFAIASILYIYITQTSRATNGNRER